MWRKLCAKNNADTSVQLLSQQYVQLNMQKRNCEFQSLCFNFFFFLNSEYKAIKFPYISMIVYFLRLWGNVIQRTITPKTKLIDDLDWIDICESVVLTSVSRKWFAIVLYTTWKKAQSENQRVKTTVTFSTQNKKPHCEWIDEWMWVCCMSSVCWVKSTIYLMSTILFKLFYTFFICRYNSFNFVILSKRSVISRSSGLCILGRYDLESEVKIEIG